MAKQLVRHGFGAQLARAAAVRLHSRTVSIGVRRDLAIPHATPEPRVDVEIRRLQPGDDLSFLDPRVGTPWRDALVCFRLWQLALREPGMAWVAVGSDGVPCYIQWLIPSAQRRMVQREWGGLFPELAADEALFEGSYLAIGQRGNGIMAYALDRIARAAEAGGARWVLGFTQHDNVAALRSSHRAGFQPYMERVESWSLFHRHVAFRALPSDARLKA